MSLNKMFKCFLQNKKIDLRRGFTLVEMMVAIAVFSIVMVVATGALLNVIDANQKAQAIKTAINNVNFALESISKDMRVGTDYSCFVGGSWVGDCSSNGTGIRYRSPRGYLGTDGKKGYAYYRYNSTDKSIEECLENTDGKDCSAGLAKFNRITSDDIEIGPMNFYVIGTGVSSPKTQPRMILTLTGTAGKKEKIKTSFDLQTGVSQRARPFQSN